MSRGLTIGGFSRATHLSVKTLRHYHDVGLLKPSFVDPGNGYRHYTQDQIPIAQVIRRLRDLEMPVPEVRAVVATDDAATRNALIAAHLDRLEGELERTRRAVGSLRGLLGAPQTTLDVERRSVAPIPAIGITAAVDRGDILAWWEGALGELNATVRAQGLRRTGPSGGVYASDLYENEHGAATVFIPVDGEVRPVGRVERVVVPAAELAITVHRGSLADIDVTFGALAAYATTHEISVDGPLRETYLRDAHDTDDAEAWETEVGWPIFRADRAGG